VNRLCMVFVMLLIVVQTAGPDTVVEDDKPAQVNDAAIEAVAAGELTEAKASWWGFDAGDSTGVLQAAINSGVPRLIVDSVGSPWIVRPMQLASNQEIIFERGVHVVAKRGEFKSRTAALFTARSRENITLIGYGATWRMWRQDYDNPDLYEPAEWRHCLAILSSTNIKVYGLTLSESGGDGIYLGNARGVTNKNIHIKDVVCERQYRQGISVITAEDLLIENTIVRNTAGTPPEAGIDFEPNSPTERLVNCVMRDCLIEGNKSVGIALSPFQMNAESEPISLRFENCRIVGNHSTGVWMHTGTTPQQAMHGSVEFVECVFERNDGAAININKPADRCLMRFEGCSVLEPAPNNSSLAPVMFSSSPGAELPVGGVEFADLLIRDPVDRNPMAYCDGGGGVPWEHIIGTFIIEKAGERTLLPLTDELLLGWMPVSPMKLIPRLPLDWATLRPLVEDALPEAFGFGFASLRGMGRFLLWARQGDEVSFTVDYRQVGKYGGQPLEIIITSPAGEEAYRAEAAFKEKTEVRFTAPETGAYRIHADPGVNWMRIFATSHRINLDGGEGFHFICAAGDYVFYVPPGTREFGVRVVGQGTGEAIAAALLNPAGEIVRERDNTAEMRQFEVELEAPSPGEVWTIRLAKPSQAAWEDFHVDLRGIPPVLAPSAEALLVPGE